MFDDNFSFGSRSSSLSSSNASSPRETSRSVSPCSAVTAYPQQYTVTDLAACLANSRLRQDAQMCYDSCEAYANMDDDAGWQLDPIAVDVASYSSAARSRSALPPQSYSSSRRSQRQSTSRMLCSTTHHKDIAALVSRMVESNEQCSVLKADSRITMAADADNDDDEGYDSDVYVPSTSRRSSLAADKARLEYRRCSELKSTGACVKKAIRFRKEKASKRPRSAELSS